MKLRDRNILIISNEPWGDTWFSKQHYATELSKDNTVFFINPPDKWKIQNIFSFSVESKNVSQNLTVLSYNNNFPLTVRFPFLSRLNSWIIYKKINHYLKKNHINKIIFWSFDPFRLNNPSKINASFSIYHCMDLYVNKSEFILAKNVDLIITVSKTLSEKFNNTEKHVVIIPHGIPDSLLDERKFERIPEKNEIVLIGSIAHRIDYELLCKIADQFEGYTLKMIGSIYTKRFSPNDFFFFNELKKKKNVFFTGAKSFDDLPSEITGSKLCLCCYKQDWQGNKLNSLKILQYLACGKPVVSTYMEEYDQPGKNHIIRMAKSHSEFIAFVGQSLEEESNPIEQKKLRIAYASNFVYSKLVSNISIQIKSHFNFTHPKTTHSNHIVFIIANQSSVPYFKWFAEESRKHSEFIFSFISLLDEKPLMLEEMANIGCKCYWIYFDWRKRKRNMLNSCINLFILFKKIKPDIIHTHLFDDSLPALLAGKLAGIKIRVITKQDAAFHWYYKPAFVPFDRLNNKMATHIHSVGTENKKFLIEKEKAPKEKIHLIRNGFPYDIVTNSDEQTIHELKNTYHLNNKFVIGTVARLIEWKGHQYIISAAEKLIVKYPNLVFLWAGTGSEEYKNKLIDLIKNKNLENYFVFTDWLERSKMPSLYKCMNMYLHPAVQEPFGFVISEALMNGIAVATTKTGSSDLLSHQINGFLLREKNIDDIIESVIFYYENPEKRKEIAVEGQNHSKKHLVFNNMWEGHVNMYKEAIKKTYNN